MVYCRGRLTFQMSWSDSRKRRSAVLVMTCTNQRRNQSVSTKAEMKKETDIDVGRGEEAK